MTLKTYKGHLLPNIGTGTCVGHCTDEAFHCVCDNEQNYLLKASENSLSIRFCFRLPILPLADVMISDSSGHRLFTGDDSMQELLIPLRPADLVLTTVSGLINEFTRCIRERYRVEVEKLALAVEALWISYMAADTASHHSSFEGALFKQQTLQLALPRLFSRACQSSQKVLRIDALMNGNNTLDLFFPVPRRYFACTGRPPVTFVYDAFVEWQKAARSREQSDFRHSGPAIYPKIHDLLLCRVIREDHLTYPMPAANGVHRSLYAARRPETTILTPIPLNPLHSIYVHSDRFLSSFREDDCPRNLEALEEVKDNVVTSELGLDLMDPDPETLWNLLNVRPKKSGVKIERGSSFYDLHQKLRVEECSARDNLLYHETSAFHLICQLSADSMQCISSLCCLKGELGRPDALSEGLEYHSYHKGDAIPMVDTTPDRKMHQLCTRVNKTVTLGIIFAKSSITKSKSNNTLEGLNNKLKSQKIFPELNSSPQFRVFRPSETAKSANTLGRVTTLPILSSNTFLTGKRCSVTELKESGRMVRLSEEDYEAIHMSYIAGRRQIISAERKTYYDLMQTVYKVQRKQKQLDELALLKAQKVDLKIYDTLSFDCYANFYDIF